MILTATGERLVEAKTGRLNAFIGGAGFTVIAYSPIG